MTPEEWADDICWWTSQGLRDRVVATITAAIAEERSAHKLTIKMMAELFDEIRAQWGEDYLWSKWGLDGEMAAILARTP